MEISFKGYKVSGNLLLQLFWMNMLAALLNQLVESKVSDSFHARRESESSHQQIEPISKDDINTGNVVYISKWSACTGTQGEDVTNIIYDNHDQIELEARHHLTDESGKLIAMQFGTQTREVRCQDAEGKTLELSACNVSTYGIPNIRYCTLPLSCKLGDWRPWKQLPDGSMTRIRQVLVVPQGNGKDCDQVKEVQPPATDPRAHWVVGAWSTCKVFVDPSANLEESTAAENKANDDIYQDDDDEFDEYQDSKNTTAARCGGGTQTRKLACVGSTYTQLHEEACAHLDMPTLVQPCEVPCPRDCKVGEWSEWSPCQPMDGCPLFPVQQLTTTGYSIRRRRVTSAASGGGVTCPPLEEKRGCSTPKCASWEPMPWGPCVLNKAHAAKACGAGKRTREFRCVGHDGKDVMHAWCSGGASSTAGPGARSERCRIACPRDCVVSAWGAWSPCSAPCAAPAAPPPQRERRRHVLAHSTNDIESGGWDCPPEDQLVQHESCNLHACNTYSWLATPWGPCQRRSEDFVPASNYTDFLDGETIADLDEDEPCIEEGEMTRDVMCVQNNADIARDALCAPLKRPASRRACTVRCHRNVHDDGCRRGPWKAWSACPTECDNNDEHMQTRERDVIGGPNCGSRMESRKCPPMHWCVNAHPQWMTSDWMTCSVPPGQTCGYGIVRRYVWCANKDKLKLEPAYCAGLSMPTAARTCFKPCGDDKIQISCDDVCKNPLRYVDASDMPKCVCPNMSLEYFPIDSDCILPPRSECGRGKMFKAAKCINNGVDLPFFVCEAFHPIDKNCSASSGLQYSAWHSGLVAAECSVPCPRDCVAGAWGAWGPCTRDPAALAAYQYRSREVESEAVGTGRACGATMQRAACPYRAPRWSAPRWPRCTPAGRGRCDRTLLNRTVECLDGEGAVVAAALCAESGPAPAEQMACKAPCPHECVLSAWSEWSPCEMTKWGGRRDRTRVMLRAEVVTEAGAPVAEAGTRQDCGQLVQAEPCALTHYSWHAAPWADCQPLGSSACGEGVKRRSVQCLRSDGVFVEDSFCQKSSNSSRVEGGGGGGGDAPAQESWCYVPCGADCAVGEWGAWDRGACACGDTVKGHALRTRKILSEAVWPGRACPAVEQRIPCPHQYCMRLVSLQQNFCPREVIHSVLPATATAQHVDFCGWIEKQDPVGCQPLNEGGKAFLFRNLTDPSRCAPIPPGVLSSPPPLFMENYCEKRCGGCYLREAGVLGPWSEWGPCKNNSRSRTRKLIAKPLYSCDDLQDDENLTIEWSKCGNGIEKIAHEKVPINMAVENSTVIATPIEDGYCALLEVLYIVTIIVMCYTMYMTYRAIRIISQRRRQMQKISKV